jgi:hypothetical protein
MAAVLNVEGKEKVVLLSSQILTVDRGHMKSISGLSCM